MEIECPICFGKVLPFRITEGSLAFLCINKKCSFPVGYDYFGNYQYPEEDFPACLRQVQSTVLEFQITRSCSRRKHRKNSQDLSESTDLDQES